MSDTNAPALGVKGDKVFVGDATLTIDEAKKMRKQLSVLIKIAEGK